jgi:hypothetical protein
LVKMVTCHVVAGRPWSSASTDLQLGIHLFCLLESVIAKPTHERLKGGAGHPLGPLVIDLYTFPPHVKYSPGETLILVEFQISL